MRSAYHLEAVLTRVTPGAVEEYMLAVPQQVFGESLVASRVSWRFWITCGKAEGCWCMCMDFALDEASALIESKFLAPPNKPP